MIAFVLSLLMLLQPVTPMTTIAKGAMSNMDAARQVVVHNDAEWSRLWTQHDPDRPRPSVDFSSQMVVGVFMGSRTTAGFSVAIVSVNDANGVLTVQYRETIPAGAAITAQVITSPFHLVAVPKTASEVKFAKLS
jgi:hypothetical protein